MVSTLLLGILLMAGIPANPVWGQIVDPTNEAPPAEVEQIEQLLRQADLYVEQQELAAGYDLYLRVLGLEPTNQHAREHIFEIINTYKDQLGTAQEEENVEQVKLYYQRYRNSVRDFLQMLTIHLKRGIQEYGELVTAQKAGQDVTQEIVRALRTLIQILEDLKTIYQEFPQTEDDTANTEKIVERLNQTIEKYKQELSLYPE